MKFSRNSNRYARAQARLQFTSMIDVIFLLLIFFMATTTLSAPESKLTSALQTQQGSGRAADLQPQIIDVALVDGSPAFRVGDRVMRDKAALVSLLRELPQEGGVFVRVDDAVDVAWAASALQACHDAGFTKVNYVPAE